MENNQEVAIYFSKWWQNATVVLLKITEIAVRVCVCEIVKPSCIPFLNTGG